MFRHLQWMLISALPGLLLAVMAAQLPAEIKKIGLFSVVMGAMAAGLLLAVTRQLDRPIGRRDFVLVGLFASAAEAVRILETYRQFRAASMAALQKSLTAAGPLAEMVDAQTAIGRAYGWTEFLEFRYAGLPFLPAQPTVLIAAVMVEILLAGGAALVVWRQLTQRSTTQISLPQHRESPLGSEGDASGS